MSKNFSNDLFKINLDFGSWFSADIPFGKIFLRGTIYKGTEEVAIQTLGNEIFGQEKDVGKILSKYSGFYSLLIITEKRLVAAVDVARSIPLFFHRCSENIMISDNADWIRKEVNIQEINVVSKRMFQLSENVLNNGTLFAEIMQIKAGEYLDCTMSSDKCLETEIKRYFSYTYRGNDTGQNIEELQIESLSKAFEKLIKYADGRQIAVPLSGGYDSRLIASMLKRSGYKNIVTFSYGLKGNSDAEFSKVIAEKCNLKWHFVEYTNEKWQIEWQKTDRFKCQIYASQWSSLPHMQDWLAIKELKKDKIINDDCIIVPGHRGVLCGLAYLPVDILAKKNIKHEEFVDSIWKCHFSLSPKKDIDAETIGEIKKQIGQLSDRKELNESDFIKLFECWEWQERQTKFLVNSVRVYEFLGFEWWLPLWDKDFIETFLFDSINIEEGRKSYDELVKKIFSETTGYKEDYNIGNASDSFKHRVVMFVKRLTLKSKETRCFYKVLKNVCNKVAMMRNLANKNDMAFEGRYPKEVYNRLSRNGYKINGIHSYQFLSELEQVLSDSFKRETESN